MDNERANKYWTGSVRDVHGDVSSNAFLNYFKEINDLMKFESNDSVLSIGCGEGSLDFLIIQNSGCKLTGYDFSGNFINLAKQKNPNANYFVHDFHKSLNDERFNKIYSFSVMQYAKPKSILSILKSSLVSLEKEGLLGHFDIPDISKRNELFKIERKSFFLNRLRVRLRSISLWVFGRFLPLWKDGSYFHDVDKLVKELEILGYEVDKVDANCAYRSHILVRKI